jgi:hypothetical protein
MVQIAKKIRNKHPDNPNSYLASQRELFVDVKSLATKDSKYDYHTHTAHEKSTLKNSALRLQPRPEWQSPSRLRRPT